MDLIDEIEDIRPQIGYGSKMVTSVVNSDGESELSFESGDERINIEPKRLDDLSKRLLAVKQRIEDKETISGEQASDFQTSDSESEEEMESEEDIDISRRKHKTQITSEQEETNDNLNFKGPINNGLPQLDIDVSGIVPQGLQRHDFNQNKETQVIESGGVQIRDTQTQILPEVHTGEYNQVHDSLDDIETRTARIIEQRKLQRQQLNEDISNITLTDEEEDEVGLSKATIFHSRKTLNEAQKFIDIKKRENLFNLSNNITKTNKFSKSQFLKEFELADEPETEISEEIEITDPKTTPTTSPLKPSQHPFETYKANLNPVIVLDDETTPELSKDVKLMLLKKIVKKPAPKVLDNKKLFHKLYHLNIDQLNKVQGERIEVEDEEEEEMMGNLLEREIEYNRQLRKKEKLREKAKMALLGELEGNFGENGNDDNQSVDESDYGSEEDEDEEEEEEVEEGEEGEEGEDEDEEDEEKESNEFLDNEAEENEKEIDEQSNEEDEQFQENPREKRKKRIRIIDIEDEVHISLEEEKKDHQAIEIVEREEMADEYEISLENSSLFSNLKPATTKASNENEESLLEGDQSFGTQLFPLQDTFDKNLISTQVDTQIETTQRTQVDNQSQNTQRTEISETTIISKDEDVTPETVKQGKLEISLNQIQDDEEEMDANEENMEAQIKLYEEKIRLKELTLLKRRKEMERKGVKNIIEGEAEESEDEWAGVGGQDGEEEEVANSEDERMIDNNFNIDLNDETIRKKFMEQYQIKDQKELEKLMDDVKNHKLIKKAATHGLNIELSDEEDELLMAYKRQKIQEQRLRLQQNEMLFKKIKTEKSQAFFKCIEDDQLIISIDEEEEDEIDRDDEPDLGPKVIEESFIKSKLSFLSQPDNEYDQEQRLSNLQYDLSDEDDNLFRLKQKSFNNLNKRPYEDVEIETDNDQDMDQASNQHSDDEFLPMLKPSIIKSFKSATSSQSFTGVTISKRYKVASGSKASVMYISKRPKPKGGMNRLLTAKANKIA